MKNFTLIVITGPTASGKTAAAIQVAKLLNTEIISADSRQIYRGIPIVTAAPTPEELAAVKHHFVSILELDQYYSAAQYETDVLALIEKMRSEGKNCAVMAGGSMMYVDAVTKGLDDLPTISDEIRSEVLREYETHGITHITDCLRKLDPEYLVTADLQNYRRLIHALEIIRQSGRKYSELRTGQSKIRPFTIRKFAPEISREELFDHINRRVEAMVAAGLEQEARSVYHLRHLNSLNTVGLKEMFALFDGTMDRQTAIARIQKNTRVYAKKQLTWLKRDSEITWLPPQHLIEGCVRDML